MIYVIFLNLLSLALCVFSLDISYDEALIYYGDFSVLQFLAKLGVSIFSQNNFGLRSMFLLLHALSCVLIYLLALKYTKTKKDALWALVLFILLPGVCASSVLVNKASYIIFLSLAILCAYEYKKNALFVALSLCALFVDKAFVILFLAFFIYFIVKKDYFFSFLFLFLFIFCLGFYDFHASGKPKGYFLDTLAIFLAVFSPFVFAYFLYSLYKFREVNILYFLSFLTFVILLGLSFRQKVVFEDFLPFCVIFTPILVKTFMASYRVRLNIFRIKHKIFIQSSFIVLFLSYVLTLANPLLYLFVKPQQHFAKNYHFASKLAKELKNKQIYKVKTNKNLALRLKFYGIAKGKQILKETKDKNAPIKIKILNSTKYYTLT